MNGYVYIIKKKDELIKVGSSIKPNIRIRQIETQGGFLANDFFISQKCFNYHEIEKHMHKLLSKHRQIGEWFKFDFNEAVQILEKQNYQSPLTQKELKANEKKQVDFMAKVSGIEKARELITNEEQHYHCIHCMCPKERWKPLKTYNDDKSCQLESDFFDVIWGLEEQLKYDYGDILSKCANIKFKYKEIENFEETLKEMITDGIDTGIITKYVRLNVISLKN